MGRLAAVVVIAFVLGALAALAYVAVSGGWYEYRVVTGNPVQMVNEQGWEPVDPDNLGVLRRPRVRLG